MGLSIRATVSLISYKSSIIELGENVRLFLLSLTRSLRLQGFELYVSLIRNKDEVLPQRTQRKVNGRHKKIKTMRAQRGEEKRLSRNLFKAFLSDLCG